MPFNGSGTFVSLAPPDFPALPFTTILASSFNANLNDIFTNGLTKCLTRDGQSTPTANLPMAGFKLTGLSNGVADTDSAALGQTVAARGSIGAVDWDTRTGIGVFEGTAASLTGPAANFPPTSDLGQLVVLAQGAVIEQLYYTGFVFYSRRKLAGVWSSWVTFAASKQVQSITATVAANALTFTFQPTSLDFRSTTAGSGATTSVTNSSVLTLTVPSTATLGTVNAVASRIALLAINNAGTMELAVINAFGGFSFDETGIISTTILNGSSTSAGVAYSTTARANVAYRVVGFADSTQATAGTWVSSPTLTQGQGGQALVNFAKITRSISKPTTSGTSVDFAGAVYAGVKQLTVTLNAVSTNGTSLLLVQLGVASTPETTGYTSSVLGGASGNVLTGATSTSGFLVTIVVTAATSVTASFTLTNTEGNIWIASGTGGTTGSSTSAFINGGKTLAGVLDSIRITTVNGIDTFDSGSANITFIG